MPSKWRFFDSYDRFCNGDHWIVYHDYRINDDGEFVIRERLVKAE